jgi:hypothetical protein
MYPGTTQVSSRVKFQATCSGMVWIATQVRRRVTRSGTAQVSKSGKVLGSDSGKESDTVSDKGLGKRPGKNLGKEGGQDKMCMSRRFLCFKVNPS